MRQFLSLGAGVQSSYLLLRCALGEIGDGPRDAIFADTGDEPAAVYEHLDWLEAVATAHGITIHRVTAGDLRGEVEDRINAGRFLTIPVHTTDANGRHAIMKRQCTEEYKILPVVRKMRELMGAPAKGPMPGKVKVALWLGISYEEMQRQKMSQVAWIENRWPLVETRTTRAQCLAWFDARGLPRPPKSSCLMCPFHSRATWQRMARQGGEEWERLKTLDDSIRHAVGTAGTAVYLHRDCIPLASLSAAAPPQLELFSPNGGDQDDECFGHCGT